MAGQYDHRERAEKLLNAISADKHRDLEVTALAAVAEAALAVADELAGLRSFLGLTMEFTEEAKRKIPKDIRGRGGSSWPSR